MYYGVNSADERGAAMELSVGVSVKSPHTKAFTEVPNCSTWRWSEVEKDGKGDLHVHAVHRYQPNRGGMDEFKKTFTYEQRLFKVKKKKRTEEQEMSQHARPF